jgi:hypothetical protein
METVGSLQCLEEQANVSYPESDEFGLQLPIHFPKIHSSIIFPSTLGLPSGLFPFRFSNQNTVGIFHLSHACYMIRNKEPLIRNLIEFRRVLWKMNHVDRQMAD